MVGNDIVDLKAGASGKWADARFVARVFTEAERRQISRGGEPDRVLWTLFAAKEAVFKAEKKRDCQLVFSPVEIEVDASLAFADLKDVARPRYRLEIKQDAGFVHVIASIKDEDEGRRAVVIRKCEASDVTAARVAARLALRKLGLPSFEICRDKLSGRLGPPYFKNAPVGLDLSLSHDGNLAAAVVSCR